MSEEKQTEVDLVTILEVASHEYDRGPDFMLAANHDKLKAARKAISDHLASSASRMADMEKGIEAAFRGGFLAGTSYGMNQAQGHDDFNAPDENAAWAEYKSSISGQGPGLSAEEGKE